MSQLIEYTQLGPSVAWYRASSAAWSVSGEFAGDGVGVDVGSAVGMGMGVEVGSGAMVAVGPVVGGGAGTASSPQASSKERASIRAVQRKKLRRLVMPLEIVKVKTP